MLNIPLITTPIYNCGQIGWPSIGGDQWGWAGFSRFILPFLLKKF
jgi:hypothetical protein